MNGPHSAGAVAAAEDSGEAELKTMIGARKGSSPFDVSVQDLAFFYDEMVRSHLLELEIQTPQGKIVLKRLSKERDHPHRRRTDFLGEPFTEFQAYRSSSAPAPAASRAEDDIPPHFKKISSPIIGVFYRASSPQSAPFVKEGDVVDSQTTICIVEAMKVMNEIKTDCRCRIVKILAKTTKPVTKNQPLFFVEPAV